LGGGGRGGDTSEGMAGEALEGPEEPPIEPCAPAESPLPVWECPAGPYEALPLSESEEETIHCTSEVNWAEGPLWSAADQTLYFSSFDERDEEGFFDGSLMTFREDEGCVELFANIGTNGLAPGPAGFLIAGRQTNRTLSLVELATGQTCSLVDAFEGSRFSSPNDVAVRNDGNIYFTDPAWNLGERPEELPQSLYRIDPEGELSVIDVFAEQRPNGVSLSPDGALLYVAILGSVQVYDVDLTGTPENRREFVSGIDVDGMAIDCAGNVFLSSGDVYSPTAELLGEFWGGTNLAFGGPDGKTLFIAGHGRLTSRPVNIPGMPY
jgi:gluconolactonase